MCDFAPRDGLNISDAIDEHRRVICAAFGVPLDQLTKHPMTAFMQEVRRFKSEMDAKLNDSFNKFSVSVSRPSGTEGQGPLAVARQPTGGSAFNLDALFRMGEGAGI